MVWRVARTYLRPLLTMMGVDSGYSNSCQILDHPRREIKVGMQIQKKITHVRMIIDHPDIGFGGRGSQTIQTFWLMNTLHSATCMQRCDFWPLRTSRPNSSPLGLSVELSAQSTSVPSSRPSPSIVSDSVDRWPRRHKPTSSGRRLKSTSND